MKPTHDELLPSLPIRELEQVTGGAGMDMMSMMLPMMMMKKNQQQAAPAPMAIAPQAPTLMVDGVPQQAQPDGQGGYVVNAGGDEE